MSVDGSIVFSPNMFIGPDVRFLISWGAKYVPCMRKDISIFSKLSEQREKEVRRERHGGACAAATS